MYSQTWLQQKINLANYSMQINAAILSEMDGIAHKIEQDLKTIYEDIVTFESEVIPKDDELNIINNLK